MKRTLTNPVFLTCLLLASINQISEKGFGVFVPMIHSYLDDLLCFPIVLTLGLAAYRWHWPNYRLTLWHMLPVFLVYSFYFEVYLPKTSSNYTSDFVDVLMYLCGLAIFGYFINDEIDLGLDTILNNPKS
ncbi:MAG: hypothetical protein KBF73_00640 [Flavobacteriales bacterium]|nr:hypothetical protein [Flavobacteriales bacterium]